MDPKQKDLDLLIKLLRQKVKATQFNGIVPRTHDQFLARFIRAQDGNDIEKPYKTIKKYYECIHKHMDYHQGIKPSDYGYVCESKAYLLFKHRFNGVGVGVCRVGLWDPKVHPLIDCQRATIFVAEEYLSHVDIQENGISAILDCEGIRMEHLWHATITEIRRCIEVALYGLPARIISLHLLRPPSIIWPFFYLAKRFLDQTIINKIHYHSNFESLHQHFNKEFLPDCLGGDLSDEEAAETHVIEQILREDIPFEKYWNGALWTGQEK